MIIPDGRKRSDTEFLSTLTRIALPIGYRHMLCSQAIKQVVNRTNQGEPSLLLHFHRRPIMKETYTGVLGVVKFRYRRRVKELSLDKTKSYIFYPSMTGKYAL